MPLVLNNPADLEIDNGVGQTTSPDVRSEGSAAKEDTMWEELFGTEDCADDDDEPELTTTTTTTTTTTSSNDLRSNKENILATSPPPLSLSAEFSGTQCFPPTDHHPTVEPEKTPSVNSAQDSNAQPTPQPPAILAAQSEPLSRKNGAAGISREATQVFLPTTCDQRAFRHYQDVRGNAVCAFPPGVTFGPDEITFLPPTIVQASQDEGVAGTQAASVIQGPSPPQASGKEAAQQGPAPHAKASKRKAAGDETTRRVKGKKKAEEVQPAPVVTFASPSFRIPQAERPPPTPVDFNCMTLYHPPIPHLRSQQLAPNEALYARELPVKHVLHLVFAQWHNTQREPVFPEELDLPPEVLTKVPADRLPTLLMLASIPPPIKHAGQKLLCKMWDASSDEMFKPVSWDIMKMCD